jgi:hypothetical protein
MAKKSKMNAYILLDRSGSMETLWKEALGSINGYVKELPKDANVFMAVFDSIGYDVIRNTTAGEWKPVSNDDATPRGGTPLFDASARMMLRILDDKPDKAVFVVMTDGEENHSQIFKQANVKVLAKNLEDKEYQVLFLGANFDKVGDTANQYGFKASSWTNITPTNLGATMSTLGTASMNYMTGTARGVDITDDLKKKATG